MQAEYKKTVLDNGICILTQKVEYVRSAALGIFVESGTNDENASNNGIAHFIEHLSFKATKNRSAYAIVEDIESKGGHINAYTSRELTAYYARVLDKELYSALEVLNDIVFNSTYPPAEIRREKTVIAEEIRDSLDTPQDIAADAFVSQMYPGHPYGYPILGTLETLKSFTSAKVRNFIEKYYAPERIIVAAVGALEHSEFVEKAAALMGENRRNATPRFIPPAPKPAEKERIIERDIAQCHYIMGCRALSYNDERRYIYSILNGILSAGMSSRLFHNIRERYGFVYTIFSFADTFQDIGTFGVYTATEQKYVKKLKDLIWLEFNRLKEEDVSESELNKVKAQAKGSLVMSLESMHRRLERMVQQYIRYREINSVDETLRRIGAVNAADIRALAKELFEEKNYHSLLLKPKGK